MTATGDNASNGNWPVTACSQTTYCCRYDGDVADENCCQNSERVFDAGPAMYGGGISVSTSLYPVTMISTRTTDTSAPASSSSRPLDTGLNAVTTETMAPTPSSSSPPPDDGLSTGAKAGIGIGASLGALFLIGIGALLVMIPKSRRARQEKQSDSMFVESTRPGYGTAQDVYRQPEVKHYYEVDAKDRPDCRYELMTQKRGDPEFRSELSG